MSSDLRELYQAVIIDHGKNPRNFNELAEFTHKLEGYNPLCGDHLTLYVRVNDGIIEAASFTGSGCAISMASASLMSEALINKTVTDAEKLYEQFHDMLVNNKEISFDNDAQKLAVLAGVKEFPMRVKCATLAWHTLKHSLSGSTQTTSTE